MLKKVFLRFSDEKGHHSKKENLNWLESHCSEFKEFAISLDNSLWEEAKNTSKILKKNAEKVLENVEYNLGGGGIYPLLYFITRYTKPDCIVETGVAAGFSSNGREGSQHWLISKAPETSSLISTPHMASGMSPTGVNTENLPPTLSGIT